jgi:hypothetical protein
METIPEKRGVSIAARAIVVPLRAAESSSPFGHLARRDGGWSAQSPRLWASIRAKFLLPARLVHLPVGPRLGDGQRGLAADARGAGQRGWTAAMSGASCRVPYPAGHRRVERRTSTRRRALSSRRLPASARLRARVTHTRAHVSARNVGAHEVLGLPPDPYRQSGTFVAPGPDAPDRKTPSGEPTTAACERARNQ